MHKRRRIYAAIAITTIVVVLLACIGTNKRTEILFSPADYTLTFATIVDCYQVEIYRSTENMHTPIYAKRLVPDSEKTPRPPAVISTRRRFMSDVNTNSNRILRGHFYPKSCEECWDQFLLKNPESGNELFKLISTLMVDPALNNTTYLREQIETLIKDYPGTEACYYAEDNHRNSNQNSSN